MDLLQGLNERQVQAVTSASPLILALAGAGSGKTTVLTKRVANLFLNHKVSTDNMLCLTFTRLAGTEMKERVVRLVGVDDGIKLFCNTFHSFAVAALKKHGRLLGLDENFSIYDQETREIMIRRIIAEFGNRTTIKKVSERFENCVDYREEKRKYPEECRVLMEYGYRCKTNNAVDLDRLIDLVIRLWDLHPEILADYRKQYKYVFVDEFQDTNDEQAQMIDMLNPDNLFVVGDDFQAIYGWRGAKVQFILDFAKLPKCEVIKLEDNYRSTAEIVNLANRLIKHNVNQTDKTLIAHKNGSLPLVMVKQDTATEYKLIADIVQSAYANGTKYKGIAVLARTNKYLDYLQGILQLNQIPCLRITSANYDPFKHPDVKKVLDWMNILTNDSDNMAFKRCACHLGAPDIEIAKLELESLRNDTQMYDLVCAESNQSWGYMQNAIKDIKKAAEDDLTALYQFNAIANSPILKDKLSSNALDAARADIERWMKSLEDATSDCTSSTFLQFLKYKDVHEKLMDDSDAVRLMTIHGSKGLEFDTVILGGMNQGVFPSKRGDIEEERRLAYVAITRAKKELYITYSQKLLTWSGDLVDALPSQFLSEIE